MYFAVEFLVLFIPDYENENIAGPVMKLDGSICVKMNYFYRY